jgi:hypothetical protein
MPPTDLIELFESNPEQPYRLSLASGEFIDVSRAADTTITGSMLFVPSRSRGRGINDKMRIVSLVNIATIVPVDRPSKLGDN